MQNAVNTSSFRLLTTFPFNFSMQLYSILLIALSMSILSATVSLLAANAKRALRRPVCNHALQKDIMQDSSWADVRKHNSF